MSILVLRIFVNANGLSLINRYEGVVLGIFSGFSLADDTFWFIMVKRRLPPPGFFLSSRFDMVVRILFETGYFVG
ncbi:unnamed protein product [Ectocarpus sp. 6 AP-2014]